MAAVATENGNGGMEEEMDDVEKEIIQGRSGGVKGIIFPPPDIRAVVDKTAQWVARNGKSFETRILSSAEGQSAKFNFMRPGDPYNAYYEHKIQQFEEGKGEEAAPEKKKPKVGDGGDGGKPAAAGEAKPAAGVVATSAAATTTVGKASVLGPIAKAQRSKPSGAPPAEEFYMTHPEGLSALDVEVIKLTAQYTAASGRQFLAALAQKEQRNPLFDFLKPSHLLFSYFTTLVDAYIKVLQPTDAQRAAVADGRDAQRVLTRAVHRWEHEKEEEARSKQAQAEAEAERVAYQAVDWHDFCVVETITFAEDELLDVGMPGQEEEEEEEEEEPAEAEMDIDMEVEEPSPKPAAVPPPPPPRPKPAATAMAGDEEDEEEINVVSGSEYAPRVAGEEGLQPAMMLDPVTGKQVPVSEVGEHMRIQFIDPRYREEQKRALEKKKATALAEGADIAANVAKFAKKRTDIFGTAEDQERAIYEEQERYRQRQEENQRVIWDGSVASASTAQMSAAMAAVQQARAGGGAQAPSGPTIGPSVPSPAMPPPPPGPPPASVAAAQAFAAAQQVSMALGNPSAPGPLMMNSLQPSQPLPPPGPPPGPPPRGPPPPPAMPPAAMPIQLQEEDMGDDSMGGGSGYGGGGGGGAELLPESAFAAKLPGAVTLQVQCPADESNAAWNLQGQTLAVTVESVLRSVKELKEQLSPLLGGMPPGKMQLKSPAHGFLKDGQSLASYNIGAPESAFLELRTRSRGGR